MSLLLFIFTLFALINFGHPAEYASVEQAQEISEDMTAREKPGRTVTINNKSYLLIQKYMTPNNKFSLRLLVEDNNQNREFIDQVVMEEIENALECFNGQDTFLGNKRGGGDVLMTVWDAENDKLLYQHADMPEELSNIINGCIKVLEISDDLGLLIEKRVGDGQTGGKESYTLDLQKSELSIINK